MPDTKNAFALQSFDLANTDLGYLKGAVIQDMPANQFSDLEGIGIVREATPDEVTAANAPNAPVESVPEAD
jgi:hypothetical protein